MATNMDELTLSQSNIFWYLWEHQHMAECTGDASLAEHYRRAWVKLLSVWTIIYISHATRRIFTKGSNNTQHTTHKRTLT